MPRPARGTSRRGSTASPICSSIWCSRARARRSAREISEAIEDVGGDLNACTDRDQTSFTASLLAEHLPLGIELLADMILRPRFAADDLVREKEVVLQELGEARDTPSDIIFDDLWMAAFPDQPLGRSILGDESQRRRDQRSPTSTPGGRTITAPAA